MAVKDRVFNVEATVTINGNKVAVSGFVVNYNINKVPTAQIQLALGEGYATKKGVKSISPSDIDEGDEVLIEYNHQETNAAKIGGFIFLGIVSGITSSKASSASGTSVSVVVNCVHRLALLGGLPTISRAYVLDSTNGPFIDMYRANSKIPKSPTDKSLSGLSDSHKLDIASSPGQYLKDVLESLYKQEKSSARANNPDALDVLDDIEVAEMHMGTERNKKALNSRLRFIISQQLNNSWKTSNGITLLARMSVMLQGALLPNALSATIAPNFPLSKTAVQTVKATEIFGVNTRSVLSTIPIVGVRLLYGQDGNDAGKTGKDKQIFAQYPPAADKIEGIYEYVRPPAWAILTKNINLGKPSNVKQLGRKDEPQHKKNIVTPDKKNGKLTQNEIQLWADKLAKTMYNTRVWAKNSFTMSVPLNFNVCPGMVIAIDVSSDNVARKIFGGSVIYGQVQGVSIKSSVGRYSMNVSVAYVRNKKENDKCGFTEHPLYDKYKMEKIELY